MIAHHRFKIRPDCSWDVGRVADHQIEFPPPVWDRLPPVPLREGQASAAQERFSVRLRLSQGLAGSVHGHALATGERLGQSDRNAPGSRSQIGPVQIALALFAAEAAQGEINEQFGFLAGNQDPRGHLEFEIAPGAEADQVLQWNLLAQMAPPELLKRFESVLERQRRFGIEPQGLQLLPAHPSFEVQ